MVWAMIIGVPVFVGILCLAFIFVLDWEAQQKEH